MSNALRDFVLGELQSRQMSLREKAASLAGLPINVFMVNPALGCAGMATAWAWQTT